jgi:hypothetical protein
VWSGKGSSHIEVNLLYVSTESVSHCRKQCFSLVAKLVLICLHVFVLICLHVSALIFLYVSGPKILIVM